MQTVIEFGLIAPVQGNGDNDAVTIVTPDTSTSRGAESVYVHDGSTPGSPDGSAHAVAGVTALTRTPADRTAVKSLRHRIMLGYYKRKRRAGS
jgi:hypothetical protein